MSSKVLLSKSGDTKSGDTKSSGATSRGTESEHDCHCGYKCLYGKDCASAHAKIREARQAYMKLRGTLDEKLEKLGITEEDAFKKIARLWGMIITEELREILETLVPRAPCGCDSPICVEEGGCHDCNTFGNNDYDTVLMWSLFGQVLVWVDETNEFWKALRASGPVPGKFQGTISRAVSFRGVKYGKGCRVNLEDCFAPLRKALDEEVRAELATIPCQWAVDGKICQKGALGCCLNAHPEGHPLCIARGVIESALTALATL